MPRRFFRHGELPLVLLAFLSARPMHGYDVMAELSRHFGPEYRPSPGSVYPAIDALETEGLIVGTFHDGRTTFRTTKSGDDALARRGDLLAAIEARTGARLTHSQSLDAALSQFRVRVLAMPGSADPIAVGAILECAALEIEQLTQVHDRKGETA